MNHISHHPLVEIIVWPFGFVLDSVEKIRETYREDWKSKEMKIRQRAVALYFIDKVHYLFTLLE